jgi:hypothetical protein
MHDQNADADGQDAKEREDQVRLEERLPGAPASSGRGRAHKNQNTPRVPALTALRASDETQCGIGDPNRSKHKNRRESP